MIFIYSLFGCPFSQAAEDLIKETQVPYKIIKVNNQKDKDKYKKLVEKNENIFTNC